MTGPPFIENPQPGFPIREPVQSMEGPVLAYSGPDYRRIRSGESAFEKTICMR